VKTKRVKYKLLENHLKNYKQYKAAISILQEQLDYLIPGLQVNYQFNNNDEVEFKLNMSCNLQQPIDRSSSLKALIIHEDLIQKEFF
jgi:hypothetical protein